MLPCLLRHCLLAVLYVVLVNSDFQVKDSTVPSYLKATFNTVDENIFPNKISIRLSLTKSAGTLLCSIDANGNQLIIRWSSTERSSLIVEFRGTELRTSLGELCGCAICACTTLSLNLIITSTLQLQCNGQSMKTMQFDKSITQNPNFPTTKPQKQGNTNSAYLWLINTPRDGSAYSNPEQLQGCIFSVEYKNRPVSFNTSGTINNQCPKTCTTNACHGGVCYETYMDQPLCDCSYTFGSGPTCLDESRVINKRFDTSFLFSNIKLSWRSDEDKVLEMGNRLVTLKFIANKNILYLDQKYSSERTLNILTETYNKSRKYIIIINFGSPTTVLVLNETKTVSSAAISNGIFEYITFSSGTGVIDMAYKTENSDLSWKQLSSIIDIPTSKCHNCHGNAKLWILLIILVVLFVVIFVPLWINRRTLFRRMTGTNIESVALMKQRKHVHVDVGRTKTLHFETFSVVCCPEKIESFPSLINKLHKQLLPLKNPTIVCQLSDTTGYLQSNMHLLQLDYNKLLDDEFLVFWNDYGDEQIKSRIEELRSWSVNVEGHNKRDGGKVSFKIDKQSMEPDWKNYHYLTIDGIDEPFVTVHLLLRENWSINRVKETLIDFLKTFHSGNILRIMKEQNLEKNDLNNWLNRLMKLKMELVSFIDKDKLCVLDSVTIDECSKANGKVTMQECDGKVDYVPPLFESMTFEDSVQHLLFDKTLFIHSITDESCIVMARVRNETPSLILDKILPFLPDFVEINFVCRDKILTVKKDDLKLTEQKDDLKLAEQFDSFVNEGFLQCAVVLRYEDSLIAPAKMEANEPKETNDTFKVCKIKGNINFYMKKKVENITRELIASAAIGTHVRIMKYRWFYKDNIHYYVFMDVMKENLKDLVANKHPMNKMEIIRISQQILEGLAYLHENKILHRNLKTSNVLLNKENNIILSDFGVCKYARGTTASSAKQKDAQSFVGTTNYMAPEVLQKNEYGSSSDIWSFGMVIVEMVTGHVPFGNLAEFAMIAVISDANSPKYRCPWNYDKGLKTFIDSCLQHDQKHRKTCKELLSNNIFKNVLTGNINIV